MIWTIALWLAMQGQVDNACAQTPPSVCFYKGCEKMAVEIDGGCPVLPTTPGIDPNMTTPPKNYMMPPNLMESVTPNAPAEHVFEIRTKREELAPKEEKCADGFVETEWDWKSGCPKTNACLLAIAYPTKCVRITRELYMDGKRMGIIKGLD